MLIIISVGLHRHIYSFSSFAPLFSKAHGLFEFCAQRSNEPWSFLMHFSPSINTGKTVTIHASVLLKPVVQLYPVVSITFFLKILVSQSLQIHIYKSHTNCYIVQTIH